MVTIPALQRLRKEYMAITKNPPPYIQAKPLESNILVWHYVVQGPEKTPYEGGWYHGVLIFPSTYPYKPPQIQMITPSGRFRPNTPLCLSMSDFHPNTWNPAWSVSSILTGLLSFMLEETPTTGSVSSTLAQKRDLAAASSAFNLRNPVFVKTFPELLESQKKQASSSIVKRRMQMVSKEEGAKAVEGKDKLKSPPSSSSLKTYVNFSILSIFVFVCYLWVLA